MWYKCLHYFVMCACHSHHHCAQPWSFLWIQWHMFYMLSAGSSMAHSKYLVCHPLPILGAFFFFVSTLVSSEMGHQKYSLLLWFVQTDPLPCLSDDFPPVSICSAHVQYYSVTLHASVNVLDTDSDRLLMWLCWHWLLWDWTCFKRHLLLHVFCVMSIAVRASFAEVYPLRSLV